jgi:hypothetical protein
MTASDEMDILRYSSLFIQPKMFCTISPAVLAGSLLNRPMLATACCQVQALCSLQQAPNIQGMAGLGISDPAASPTPT